MKSSALMIGLMLVVGAAFHGGCRSAAPATDEPPHDMAAVDLDGALAKAGSEHRPIVVLAGEFGQSGASTFAREAFNNPTIASKRAEIEFLPIDLSVSRNRAAAARYHLVQPPVLICLSPLGLILSRDEGPITAALISLRVDAAVSRFSDLDEKFKSLQSAVADDERNAQAKLALAEFLLDHQNDREAIPYLSGFAGSAYVEPEARIRAWVELARAHLWIAEPEKGRHEAKNLIATMGPTVPDAVAGGNLVLGEQDATAKRFSLARREFETAIAAAPDSAYATQAREEIAKLPTESK